MNNIHKQRIILILLALSGAISVFLPWVKAGVSKTIGIHTLGYHSWIALLCCVGAIVLSTYGDKTKALESWTKYIVIALSGTAAIIGILKVLETIGFGLILLQVSSIGCVFVALNISRKKEDGINEIKELKP